MLLDFVSRKRLGITNIAKENRNKPIRLLKNVIETSVSDILSG